MQTLGELLGAKSPVSIPFKREGAWKVFLKKIKGVHS